MSPEGAPPSGGRRPPGARPSGSRPAASPPPSRQTPPPGDEEYADRVRGGVLIAVAILLGAVLFARGFSAEGGLVAAGDATTDTTIAVVDGDRDAAPPTTTPDQAGTIPPGEAARAPAEVKVLVANGSGVKGVAATFAATVGELGYTVTDTANATKNASATRVYFAEGYQADAVGLAAALELPEDAVVAMPDPPPVASLGEAELLVVVGTDRA